MESIEPDALRRAAVRGEASLRPTLDSAGRTVVLAYVPAVPAEAMEATPPAVVLTSLALAGEAVKQTAQQRFGMTRLSARVCAALVETGSLRRASRECGVTYQTAQSEMADAMHAADVSCQSALIRRLADTWLDGPLETSRTVALLMKVFELKPRDARIAACLAAGRGRAEVGARLGLSKWAIKSGCTRLFAILGVTKAPELTRIVIDLLLAADFVAALHPDREVRP